MGIAGIAAEHDEVDGLWSLVDIPLRGASELHRLRMMLKLPLDECYAA